MALARVVENPGKIEIVVVDAVAVVGRVPTVPT